MTEQYFFDSYATIETLKNSATCAPYLDAVPVMTKLNLFEVHYWILRNGSKEKADEFLAEQPAAEFGLPVIARAAELKLSNKQLSMADCIGYCLALELGIKFLTGDRAFKGMKNVEWAG